MGGASISSFSIAGADEQIFITRNRYLSSRLLSHRASTRSNLFLESRSSLLHVLFIRGAFINDNLKCIHEVAQRQFFHRLLFILLMSMMLRARATYVCFKAIRSFAPKSCLALRSGVEIPRNTIRADLSEPLRYQASHTYLRYAYIRKSNEYLTYDLFVSFVSEGSANGSC